MYKIKYFIKIPFVLLLVFVLSGCGQQEAQINKNISSAEASVLLQENKDNPDFVLVDVRTPAEFSEDHIDGAVNYDYRKASFRDDIDKLDKEKTYLIYCRSGKRAGSALEVMKELQFKEVYNIVGGIIAYRERGRH